MTDKPPSAAQRAETWLKAYLSAAGGLVLSADAQDAAAAEVPPIKPRTLQRASHSIGAEVVERVDERGRSTLWRWPKYQPPGREQTEPVDRDGVPVRRGQLGRQAAALLRRGQR
jgi:hypothetical protein